mgnify:FL=1
MPPVEERIAEELADKDADTELDNLEMYGAIVDEEAQKHVSEEDC